jgi:RimJ/RimL family protein N-acetyltransferase
VVRVREARPNDAAGVIELFQKLYSETSFMLYEPGEWTATPDDYAQRIEQVWNGEAGVMFVCENDGHFIAVGSGNRGAGRRTRHSLYVVIGVIQQWVGRGVGRALLQALEAWARTKGVHRLELTVDVANQRAIALYEKCGFEREGLRRHSRKIEESYFDEFYMSKLIVAEPVVPADSQTAALRLPFACR